ncbi:MAG: phosphoethanolamine transferase [Burkholderiaceae bacterium]
MALALPGLVWLLWPVSSPMLHRLRTGFVWLWVMGFALDGVVRAYLLHTYQAASDSSFIQTAAANTNGREASEYLSMHWRAMLLWSVALLVAGLVVGRYAGRGARASMVLPRRAVTSLCMATLVLGSVGYLIEPWRRLHPALFWTQWSESVDKLRAGWADQQEVRKRALARATFTAPTMAQEGPSTVVLVITDSVNRDNLALYGYQRATTPRLLAQKAQLQNQLLVVRNAWSVDASTLPSLRNMFLFGLPPTENPQHVLALARAAGYKVWWMSNHDDIAIAQQHGMLADVLKSVNRTPGRAGASLDGELLDDVQQALEDSAERKLIVVHLMGAHPHYSLRFPEGANPFDEQIDEVEESLEGSGRPAWVRRLRHEYDAALLYQDFVVSETLEMTRKVGPVDGYRAWMYLSDHGQEVGHVGNYAGHSRSTASGYRIPTVIWHNSETEAYRPGMGGRPFRTDWAGWTIADLLKIHWTGDATDRNVLADNYRWQAPTLPVQVESFED